MTTYPMIALLGPSGSGKSTIARKLIEEYENYFDFSISHTNRKRGENEKHKKDYFFISEKSFNRMISREEFFEWEKVYGDDKYGTSMAELMRIYDSGKVPILDIDVKGAQRILIHGSKRFTTGFEYTSIFLDVQDRAILEERIRSRKRGESEEKINQRLKRYDMEQKEKKCFSHVVENINLDQCYENVRTIILPVIERFTGVSRSLLQSS